ncbi:saga complex component [Grosmannia clavigera kw1407]|uniref:Saga complex component n=1 Tax=Grosmannia clavigera (strain kw1407 / UAMH 11150) TaxID=655863 RepID=F0XSH1_GROCL|nr:saga complex component [Grosmannia clavigera kw1407]EFW99252.1 saga complex component [Grosmannia clavigera kw1407]
MTDVRKGPSSSPAPVTPVTGKKTSSVTPKQKPDEETIKVASKKDGAAGSAPKNGVIKLKKLPPKHKQPGNWKEGTFVDQEKKKAAKSNIPAPSPSPVVNQLDETARETFATGRPLEDAPDLQICKHCKKSVLSTAAKQHIAACLKIKKEKAQRKKEAKEARERAREQQARDEEEAARRAEQGAGGGKDDDSDSDDDGGGGGGGGGTDKKISGKLTGKKAAAAAAAAEAAGGKKTEAGGSGSVDAKGGVGSNKKRKADSELDKAGPKKKKKEEVKPKTAKPKGPVDVERQCGVILPNGQPCARSLTCKSHSMGAKRAVPGRSLPYDMLLAAYQKKNQAKQQKAAIDATAPVEDEDEANSGAIDSEEEASAVMSAMARWRPQPVVPQPTFAPIRRQYQLARLHEQLNMATNGGRVNIFRVVGYGAQKLPDGHPGLLDSEDAPGEPDDAMMMLPPAQPASAGGGGGLPSVTPVLPPIPPSMGAMGASSSPSSMRNQSSPAAMSQHNQQQHQQQHQRPIPVPLAGRA